MECKNFIVLSFFEVKLILLLLLRYCMGGMLVLDVIKVLRKDINRVDIWSVALTAFSLNIHARWKINVVCLLKQHRIYTKRDSLLARQSYWFLELHSKPTRLLLHYRSSLVSLYRFLSLSLSKTLTQILAPTSLWVRFQISLFVLLWLLCIQICVFFSFYSLRNFSKQSFTDLWVFVSSDLNYLNFYLNLSISFANFYFPVFCLFVCLSFRGFDEKI